MKEISGIVLAGGFSSRMCREKADLDFHGVSFLQHQVNKLRSLGIEDIVIAGYPDAPIGCRYVPDVYPHLGPLSGIHAGLAAAEQPCAMVIAVDTPLVPEAFLAELIDAHKEGITIASCRGKFEPLIGVYDKALVGECESILRGTKCYVRELFGRTEFSTFDFSGDPVLLMNANTPEEYKELMATTHRNEEI